MLVLDDLTITLRDEHKEILHSISLNFEKGSTYLIKGANGSGKSTLASTLMADPRFIIDKGKISLKEEQYPLHVLQKVGLEIREKDSEIVLNELDATKRSLLGIFLANQYPLEVPGVDMTNYLRLIFNAHQKDPLPVFKFREVLKERMALINYPARLLERNLNEGFSGGEKKRTEILQLALLSPRYAILDETDSGLDMTGIQDMFSGISKLREVEKDMSVIVISHYEKVNEYFKFDKVITLDGGKVVATEKK